MKRCLIFLACVAACDTDSTPTTPREVLTINRSLLPLSVLEATLQAGPADRVTLVLKGSAPFDWNVHGHGNQGTTIIDGAKQTQLGNLDFVPPAQGTWYLAASNFGATAVTLDIEVGLYNQATWRLP